MYILRASSQGLVTSYPRKTLELDAFKDLCRHAEPAQRTSELNGCIGPPPKSSAPAEIE